MVNGFEIKPRAFWQGQAAGLSLETSSSKTNEVVNSKLNVVALVVTSGQAMSQLTDRH